MALSFIAVDLDVRCQEGGANGLVAHKLRDIPVGLAAPQGMNECALLNESSDIDFSQETIRGFAFDPARPDVMLAYDSSCFAVIYLNQVRTLCYWETS